MIQIPLTETNAIFLSSGETEFVSRMSLSNTLDKPDVCPSCEKVIQNNRKNMPQGLIIHLTYQHSRENLEVNRLFNSKYDFNNNRYLQFTWSLNWDFCSSHLNIIFYPRYWRIITTSIVKTNDFPNFYA